MDRWEYLLDMIIIIYSMSNNFNRPPKKKGITNMADSSLMSMMVFLMTMIDNTDNHSSLHNYSVTTEQRAIPQ